MSSLHRDKAPFSDKVWATIDKAARDVLATMLGARKVVDFEGPKGWSYSAVDLGRARRLAQGPAAEVDARLRTTQPLVELRLTFKLDREEIEAMERGAKDPDLDPVEQAARRFAYAEDRMVFHGFAEAGIVGIVEAAAGAQLTLQGDYLRYPEVVAQAVSTLKLNGIGGPYGIALGPRCWNGLTQTSTPAGYPVLKHVERLLDGPIVWAPALDGALVVSLRGGDFELTVGRDIAIGYLDHDAKTVTLYLQESATSVVIEENAAIPLVYASPERSKGRARKRSTRS